MTNIGACISTNPLIRTFQISIVSAKFCFYVLVNTCPFYNVVLQLEVLELLVSLPHPWISWLASPILQDTPIC
jgi:hypothetical protein